MSEIMIEKVNNNGYKFVDLGLPSGTKWSAMNLGALRPYDYGLYFQWGDKQGYAETQVGTGDGKKAFDGGICSKYKTAGATLELADDAAKFHMGGEWHLPTPHQINELINFTTSIWTAINGVKGRLFTSMKDKSKSIFIPASGFAWDGSVQSSGSCGIILSSMLGMGNEDDVYGLFFHSDEAYLFNNLDRYFGHTLRGVIG